MNLTPSKQSRTKVVSLLAVSIALAVAIDLIVTFVPNYDNTISLEVIQRTSGCGNIKIYKSFQYKSLQDMAIIMAAFGIIFALVFAPDPSIFVRPLEYSRFSLNFLARILIQLISAAIPLAIFANPGWSHINVDTAWLAVILWVCQSLGFFLALIMLVLVSPMICAKFKLQAYGDSEYCVALQQESRLQWQMGESPKGQEEELM